MRKKQIAVAAVEPVAANNRIGLAECGTVGGPVDFADSLELLVVGTNQCWGKAKTMREALILAAKPVHYNVFVVHEDCTISEVDGTIFSPVGFRPWLIHSKRREVATVQPVRRDHT